MAGRLEGFLIAFDRVDGVLRVLLDLLIELRQVEACTVGRLGEVGSLVPAFDASVPDELRDFVQERESTSPR